MANGMTMRKAIEIVLGAAANHAENKESLFDLRIKSNTSDKRLKQMVKDDPDLFEDALEIRDIWRAINRLAR